MEIQDRIVGGCVIIDIFDDRFEYPKTQVLKNHVMHLLNEGQKHLVLNLGNVQMLDSFGIACFISILKQCKAKNGNLTLFGLNDSMMHLMELTRMDRVLDIWQTEEEALGHVQVS